MKSVWFACIGVAIVTLAHVSAIEPLVTLSHGGKVLGSLLSSQHGRLFYAFRGIPFAEPPIGERRFQAPITKAPWQDSPLDATKDGPVCVQLYPTVVGQEDCLYLNVYTPQISGKNNTITNKLAVLVWIYGGGFTTGGGTTDYYGPGRIMDDPNIILATINYRLGALGFLSTADSEAPGNYGMLDQSLALKWIHDNIEAFGGDSNRITIFGESAGAGSVGLHLFSPMSSGLFQNAISMSGTALNIWAVQVDPLYWATQLAESFDCPTTVTAELVKCMKQIPASDIVQTEQKVTNKGLLAAIGFAPSVDGKFLQQSPRDILASGNLPMKVPLITGVTKDEGLFMYLGILKDHPEANLQLKEVINRLITGIADGTGRSKDAGELFLNKYLSSVNLSDIQQTRETVIKMITDMMFHMSHYETVVQRSKHGLTTYAYQLDYAPSYGFSHVFGSELKGVAHGDDLFLMFDGPLLGLLKPNDNDTKVINAMRTLFTNFAKFGEPTPETSELLPVRWEPENGKNIPVYHIDNPITTKLYDTSKEDLYQFWVNDVLKAMYSKKDTV